MSTSTSPLAANAVVSNPMTFEVAYKAFSTSTDFPNELRDYSKQFETLLSQFVQTYVRAILAVDANADSIDIREVAPYLSAFASFFLEHKVSWRDDDDASNDLGVICDCFCRWLFNNGLLQVIPLADDAAIERRLAKESELEFVLQTTCENQRIPNQPQEDTISGEPLYMVSRVRKGKLWFLHSTDDRRYTEFGPVNVPLGVTDLARSGTCIDARFAKVAGRWYFTHVGDVLWCH